MVGVNSENLLSMNLAEEHRDVERLIIICSWPETLVTMLRTENILKSTNFSSSSTQKE